jgi:hypothetical protein
MRSSLEPSAENSETVSAIDLIRRQNEQLTDLKDQYLRLHEQYEQEQKQADLNLLSLQREIRAEQRAVMALEDEIESLKATARRSGDGARSTGAIEEIWQLLQAYRERAREIRGPAGHSYDSDLAHSRNEAAFRTPDLNRRLPE